MNASIKLLLPNLTLSHIFCPEQELPKMMKEADIDGDSPISYEDFAASITFAAYEGQNKI